MSPEEIIEKLWTLGFSVQVRGDQIAIEPATVPAGLLAIIRQRKTAILDRLRGTEPPTLEDALREARWVFGQLPAGDVDRTLLEKSATAAKESPDDEALTLGLMVVLVDVWKRRIRKDPGQE